MIKLPIPLSALNAPVINHSIKAMADKNNIIEFPKILLKERIGTKYRVKEIEALQKYLRECDEDMTTLLDQLDIINKELLVLNKEYEAILNRIKELHEIDNNN